jgi:hypothetical protein
MNNRIIKISIDDLIIDPQGLSEMVTKACHRDELMRVSGLCQVRENILLALEKPTGGVDSEYVFSPFKSVNIDEIATEISTRFSSGFSLIGGFDVKLDKWALFELKK